LKGFLDDQIKYDIFKRIKNIFYSRVISEAHLIIFLEEFGIHYLLLLTLKIYKMSNVYVCISLNSQIKSSTVDALLMIKC
jgi:hypothetical protein